MDQWQEYLTQWGDYDFSFFDQDGYSQRLHELAEDIFHEDSSAVLVNLIDVYRDPENVVVRSLDAEEKVGTQLFQGDQPARRIISLCQDNSLEPLNISLYWMKRILHHYRVVPDFLDILFQFGYRPSVFQHNSNDISFRKLSDGSYSLCYNLTYVEVNGKAPPSDPISRRQTGMYHRYDTQSKDEIFICLHPMQNSKAEQRLKRLSCKRSSGHPLDLHCTMLSSYLHNWGPYIESLAEELTSLREKVLTVDIQEHYPILKEETLGTLRTLEDKIVFRALGGLESAISVIECLLDFNDNLHQDRNIDEPAFRGIQSFLCNHLKIMNGHKRSVEIMEKRIKATIESWSSLLELRNQAIDLRNQRIAEQLNEHVYELNWTMLGYTQESVDDNTTVKLITIFSLIYLPASFVASLLGMELFNFNEDTRKLQRSDDLWLFFALALPLTAATLTIGSVFIRKSKNQRKQKHDFDQSKHELILRTIKSGGLQEKHGEVVGGMYRSSTNVS